MNKLNHKNLKQRKKKIEKRLERRNWENQSRPMFQGSNIHYEVDGRNKGMAQGGIGVLHRLAKKTGLIKAIDQNLHLLKRHLPYHESDHVLNLCYNILAGGTRLEDIELRRQDEAWMDALGAKIIPDPTTAGGFLRRFSEKDILTLMELVNDCRVKVWKHRPKGFFNEAILNVDGTIAPTEGECKQGMDISYKGDWGYHPLVISLAQTREPLYLVNRPGNVPSHQDAAGWIDRSLDLVAMAAALPERQWSELLPNSAFQEPREPRERPENIKERIVKERGYKNIRTVSEQVGQFLYRPIKCENAYRIVVVRKNLSVEKGEQVLFDDLRYFFFITNDWDLSAHEIVYFIHERCDHENDIEQLKNGVKAMTWPVHDLVSNWAYMIIAALAWNLKAWLGLLTPDASLRYRILRMEFKQFIHTFILIPGLVIKTGRRIVYRLLGYNAQLKNFLRTFEYLRLLPSTG